MLCDIETSDPEGEFESVELKRIVSDKGLLVHGLARRSMANNWYQSFTHGLLAHPLAAQQLMLWNAYGSTSGNPSLVLAVFPFYECFISNVFHLCMFFAIFAYKLI